MHEGFKPEEKKSLIERLGFWADKYKILFALVAVVTSMETSAQQWVLDNSIDWLRYGDKKEVLMKTGEGVDAQMKEQKIGFNKKEGAFYLNNDVISFDGDDVTNPTDSVDLVVNNVPGGKKNLLFIVYNHNSTERVVVGGGDIVDYSKVNKKP